MRANPDVRVTYLTGYVDPFREQRLRRLGALAVLEKPCSIDDLLALLRARPVEHPDKESSDDTTRTYGIDQFGPNSSKNPSAPDG
jgi:ActR/RegA family two-component response regulator